MQKMFIRCENWEEPELQQKQKSKLEIRNKK